MLTENSSAFDRLYVYAIEQGLEDLPDEVEVCCTDEVCMDNAEAQIRQIANDQIEKHLVDGRDEAALAARPYCLVDSCEGKAAAPGGFCPKCQDAERENS